MRWLSRSVQRWFTKMDGGFWQTRKNWSIQGIDHVSVPFFTSQPSSFKSSGNFENHFVQKISRDLDKQNTKFVRLSKIFAHEMNEKNKLWTCSISSKLVAIKPNLFERGETNFDTWSSLVVHLAYLTGSGFVSFFYFYCSNTSYHQMQSPNYWANKIEQMVVVQTRCFQTWHMLKLRLFVSSQAPRWICIICRFISAGWW